MSERPVREVRRAVVAGRAVADPALARAAVTWARTYRDAAQRQARWFSHIVVRMVAGALLLMGLFLLLHRAPSLSNGWSVGLVNVTNGGVLCLLPFASRRRAARATRSEQANLAILFDQQTNALSDPAQDPGRPPV